MELATGSSITASTSLRDPHGQSTSTTHQPSLLLSPNMHILKTYRISVVGNPSVGKTTLIHRFVYGRMVDSRTDVSRTRDIFSKEMKTMDGDVVKLEIQDSVGQHRLQSITSTVVRNADAVLFLCDVSSMESFNAISDWLKVVPRFCRLEVIAKMLVACKCDLQPPERQVTTEQFRNFATKSQIPYIEVSSLTGQNVESTFQEVLEDIIMKRFAAEFKPPQGQNLAISGNKQSGRSPSSCSC